MHVCDWLSTCDLRRCEAAAGGGGGDAWDGNGEDDTSTGSHPQQVLAHHESCDPQTRCLVLTNDVIRSWRKCFNNISYLSNKTTTLIIS